SNLWTMGQQFYVIRNNPAPNTEAFRAKQHRDEAKRKRKGEPPADSGATTMTDTETPASPPKPVQRQQPKKQTREQRKKTGGKPTGPSAQRLPSDGQAGAPSDDNTNDPQSHQGEDK
ncbi:MAG: membrane protein insertase YidC, partial [Marmoricola sp.]